MQLARAAASSSLRQLFSMVVLLACPRVAVAQRGPLVPDRGIVARGVTAMRAEQAPVIDGRDTDAIWRTAPVITGFRVVRPVEDGDPHFRTEARIAYDAHYIYVFVRAFDAHPDSIVGLLARRDAQTPSDQLMVIVDSYHDKRNGYEFAVNPVGVKYDAAVSQDGNEDSAWDGIWDVATQVDSLGWTAEFRLPLSQLRHASAPSNTFGIAIWRTVERTNEQTSWPLFRVSKSGLASQLGDLTGLDNLASASRAEFAPYLVTKNVSVPSGIGFDRGQRLAAGADLKMAVASNLTLTGTINPDFGQVEADPAVLNLGAFETFFEEKRPFFVEGNGLFQFGVNCSAVNCSNEGLFYSRRIGRAPQLGLRYGDANSATATTILGAAKLTGHLAGGLSVGVIDAVTRRESGVGGAAIEPATNYSVVRVTQDLNGGASGVGFMFTGVNRDLDPISSPLLRREAYSGALEFRHQFANRQYELSGSFDVSRVAGSAAVIAATQRDPVHEYQRPDGALTYDSTRTSLSGDAEEIHFGKISGARLKFETSYLRRSAGFEINDIGYLRQADQQSWNTWAGLSYNTPTKVYRNLRLNFNWWQFWSAAGLPTEAAANTNIHSQLSNYWRVHLGGTIGQLGSTWCDRCARGGPAVRQDPFVAPWLGIQGDDRNRIIPSVWVNYFESSKGRNSSLNVNPQLTLNASTRLTAVFGANYSHNVQDNQWYGGYSTTDGVRHYTFAHLDQQTLSLSADLGYTFTPTLSLQWHLQPFVSRGTFSNLRELANPAADQYDARYKSYTDSAVANHLGGIDAKQFNSNLVMRWEYRPGSTLFLVWTQGRSGFDPVAGANGLRGDFRDLFNLRADNTLLVKVSYWLSK